MRERDNNNDDEKIIIIIIFFKFYLSIIIIIDLLWNLVPGTGTVPVLYACIN